MTRFEQIVSTAQHAVVVVGDVAQSHYELLDFPLPNGSEAELTARGMLFLGVIGICEGQPRSELCVALDAPTMDALANAYAARLRVALDSRAPRVAPKDDTEWLFRLWNTPDTRPN